MSVGSGHRFAAEALRDGLAAVAPGARAQAADLGALSGSALIRNLPWFYARLLRLAPSLYTRAWQSRDLGTNLGLVERIWQGKTVGAARRLLDETGADVVACTHALPARTICALKAEGRRVRLLAVPTDLGLHRFWPLAGVDWYSVGAEHMKRDLVERGFPQDRISVLGIPIRLAFAHGPPNPSPPAGRLRVLLLAGARDQGPYGYVARQMDDILTDGRRGDDFRAIVVTGNNRPLRRFLQARKAQFGQPTAVLGFVGAMDRLMDRCHLLVTKPGGLIVSEAMAKGLPMVLMGPPVGQEGANAGLLVGEGAAVEAAGAKAVRQAMLAVVSDRTALAEMAARSRALGHPRAALDVAELAVRLAQS
jgi:processive 1,2-diacylglycerol beta-glucosyltransferase